MKLVDSPYRRFTAFCLVFILVLSANANIYHIAGFNITKDENNLPIVDYGTVDGVNIGKQYNPITITHYADSYYNKYISEGDEESKINFLKHIDWLVNNAVYVGNYAFFEYTFPLQYSDTYTLENPWYSAMAQGEALPRLIDAYQITDNKTYLDSARKALNVLFIDINNPCKCGVTIKTPDAGWWYEEYPNGTEYGPRVLNGMMFALVGIYDYYNFTRDPQASYLFEQGMLSLKNNLHIYDKNGTHSLYDTKDLAPAFYHNKHVELLGKLFNITHDSFIKKYYDNWGGNSTISSDYSHQ